MRLFFAIPTPDAVRNAAAVVLEELRGAGEVRWVKPELMHLTLKFLGEVPAERREEIESAAAEIANKFSGLMVELGGVGAFPNLRKPRTVWMGIGGEGEGSLAALAESLETRLQSLGFPREDRPFRPHLTLGRVKGPRGLSELARRLEREVERGAGKVEWPVTHFHLVKSDLRPTGPVYTTLREFPLAKPLEE